MGFFGLRWGSRRVEPQQHPGAEQQLEQLLVKVGEAIALIDSGRVAAGVDKIKALRREHVLLVRQRRKQARQQTSK